MRVDFYFVQDMRQERHSANIAWDNAAEKKNFIAYMRPSISKSIQSLALSLLVCCLQGLSHFSPFYQARIM